GNPGGVESGGIGDATRERIPKAVPGIANETDVRAKLKCMRSFRPRNIIYEIVHRCVVGTAVKERKGRVVGKAVIAQAAKLDDLTVRISWVVNALTCIPPAKIVE